MNNVILQLKEWGCDTNAALKRVLGDEELYVSLIVQYKDTDDSKKLVKCLNDKDAKAAFEIAHTMKGVYGNLGLTPLYNVVCEMVEPLRNENCEGLEDLIQLFFSYKEQLNEILQKND